MEEKNAVTELSEIFSVFDKFHEVISIIHSSLSVEELERKACKIISNYLKTGKHLLLVFDPSKNKFVFACQVGFSKEESEKIIEIAVYEKDALSSHEASSLVFIESLKDLGIVVLKSKKKFIGLFISTKPICEALSAPDREFLQILALSVLYAYSNATIYEMTKKLAIWDNKTKLYNYRYFLQRLSNEVARARRYGRNLSLIAIDIDNFKEINNKVGHLVADRILVDIASIIRNSLRVVDIPSRFGGDEFFILLPETDLNGANVVVKRLKNLIESQLFPLNASKNRVKVSLSFGVTLLKEGMTAREIMEAADKDLMDNKRIKRGEKIDNKVNRCSS